MLIEFGTDYYRINVTNILNNIKKIPADCWKRCELFGIDPCPGKVKSIFINNIEYKEGKEIDLTKIKKKLLITNNKIKFGTNDYKINVTYKLNNIKKIPADCWKRCELFGIDPCPNKVKSIFINNIEYKEDKEIDLSNINIYEPKIYILIRCCYRPNYFKQCIKSVMNQTYKNINLIISYDDENCLEYLNDYKNKLQNVQLIEVEKNISKDCFYNLYCNELLNKVPIDINNWIMFLDDDDKFENNTALENIISNINSNNNFIFWKFIYNDGRIIGPNNYNELECGVVANCTYLFNSIYKNYSSYELTPEGDFEFIKKFKQNRSLNLNFKYLQESFTGTQNGHNGGKDENSEKSKKISIVMAYFNNRKNQTINTLNSINKYKYKYNFEVIIVDDNSNEEFKLNNIIKNYLFEIKLIEISKEEKGDRINPCGAYNRGFLEATGDIVIIQNPECYHVGNIFEYTLNNLKENDYFTYSCFSTNNDKLTNELINSNNKFTLINDKEFLDKNSLEGELNWYNHPIERPCNYHFCSAIYKNKLELIGGFDERFNYGYCYDDDELLLTIKKVLKLNISTIPPEKCYVIHQFHNTVVYNNNNYLEIVNRNYNLFNKIKEIHYRNDFIYPKLLHLYWDGSPMSYLNYLTVISFNEYNPEWKIIIYIPYNRTIYKSWKTDENKIEFDKLDYLYKLKTVNNVNITYINLDKIGFYNEASEVIKSDYFRYYILEKHGGLWSDFDIIYTESIEDKMNFKSNNVIFRCHDNLDYYYPIGLFLCKYNTNFFKFINKSCIENYDLNNYQTLGASLFKKLFKKKKDILDIDCNTIICSNDIYLPFHWNELDYIYNNKYIDNILPETNVGIHWFNGANISKEYINNIEKIYYDNNLLPNCLLDKYLIKYNLNISKFKIGLCFKIYVDESTNDTRYEIISELLDSISILYNNYNNLQIYGFIDCVANDKLKNIIIKYPHINFIYLNNNYGITIITNLIIETLLNNKCNFIFICDDDIIFKNNNILYKYINVSLKYNIQHLSYFPLNIYNTNFNIINQDYIIMGEGYSGCFMFFTDKILKEKGYLPIRNKYGYEHVLYTKKITGKQYDINNSDKYINLNVKSIDNRSNNNNNNNNNNNENYLNLELIKQPDNKYYSKLTSLQV